MPGTRIPPKSCCRPAQNARAALPEWRKENDILDVWFDSGSSHLAVLHGNEAGGPRMCIWKARTSTAGGSTVRC